MNDRRQGQRSHPSEVVCPSCNQVVIADKNGRIPPHDKRKPPRIIRDYQPCSGGTPGN